MATSTTTSAPAASYTPAQVASINAAREANVSAGRSAYSGAGATANSIATGQTPTGSGTPLYAAPTTINSTNTAPATPVQLPSPAPASNTGTQAMTQMAGIAATPPPAPTTTSATTTTADSDFQTYLKNLQAPPSTADSYEQALKTSGVTADQQAVATYQAQLNAITAKAQSDKLSLVGQGNGVPNPIIGGQQAEIDREAAIQSLPIAAQLASAQANLQLAQDHLDTLFKLRSEDAQNMTSYKNAQVTAVYNYATDKQKTELAAIQKTNDQNFSVMTNNLNYAQSLATAAIQNGQPSIAIALGKLDHNDPNYAANIATLAGGIKVVQKDPNGQSPAQQQADDIAQAVLDFQNTMETRKWAGANPDAYNHYKTQLINKYGDSAALALDDAMTKEGITVDKVNK